MKQTWVKKSFHGWSESEIAEYLSAKLNLKCLREEVIIIALMECVTAESVAKFLHCSKSTLSKYTKYRQLNHVDIKTIQAFQGVSRRHLDKKTYPFINMKSIFQYRFLFDSNEKLIEKYIQIMQKIKSASKPSQIFFFYVCVIAAILNSETTAIVASKLSISESSLLRFLIEKNIDFQSIKRLQSEIQEAIVLSTIKPTLHEEERPSEFVNESTTPSKTAAEPLRSPWDSSEKTSMKRSLDASSQVNWCSLFAEVSDGAAPDGKRARSVLSDSVTMGFCQFE